MFHISTEGRNRPPWVAALKRFEQPDTRKAALQIADTLIPYVALIALMYLTILWKMPYFVTFLLAIPASAFMVRLFVFFHDCSHGSYLASPRLTKILGTCLGILVFMPFFEWRARHAGHHSTSGNLDRRGIGDVWTMTVNEYDQSSGFRRLLYRISRHPAVMFGLGPLYILLIAHRLPSRRARRDAILSVIFTDLMIAAILILAVLTIGIKSYLMIELPIIFMGGAAGVWLFYIQHQFDPSYWTRNEQWNSTEAALQGSSFYKLPKLLQWFSGNIGFHHIHHLRPRIPNYNLERCLKETPELQLDCPLTLWRSLKSVQLNLWDETRRTLVSFREASRSCRA
jgi:acyl-lipid omega-6 desaturase (Delta-12 desaturase)